MRFLELPPAEPIKMINEDLHRSLRFKMLYVGVAVAILGFMAFFLAFGYQNPINATGVSYRVVQGVSIAVVFFGWLIFMVFCASLGISTRKLTYPRLVAILKNQVEIPIDVEAAIRKQVGLALANLDDSWTLYPTVFVANPEKSLSGVIVGPGGVFPVGFIYQDPHKHDFIDPMPRLVAGSKELEKQIKHPVKPLMIFLRNRKHYHTDHEDVRNYTTQEAYAHLTSREVELAGPDLEQMNRKLHALANLP